MGVPAFYRWLSQRYPKAIKPVFATETETVEGVAIPGDADYLRTNPNGELDNLYLDMNGIVHPCTHPEGRPAPETEEQMMIEVFRYTEMVLSIAKPRKVLMMAVDGVAPRAKMNQQRSRRFRSAQDAALAQEEEQRKAALALALTETETGGLGSVSASGNGNAELGKKWDINVITPGTPFMDYLARSLRYWVAYKLNTEPGWKDLKVIISDASVPGEGEHKIMEFIRSQRNSVSYNPNTSHCIYGLDADLIFLGLATHEPNFRVLREDVFNQNKTAGKERGHIWLDVGVLRQYLEQELWCEVRFWDVDRAIDDWIFMAFFCGNDFLPHLPSLDVRENGLDILLRSWRAVLPSMGGFMTKDGDVLLSRVQRMLQGVASKESEIFRRRHDIERRREESRRQQQFSKRIRWNNDSAPAAADVQLYEVDGSAVGPQQDNETKKEGKEHGGKEEEENVNPKKRNAPESDLEDNDDIRLWQAGYHDRYYESKMHIDANTEPELVREMVYKYIEGVCWVLKYYYQGCPSWTWFYPYHYAPFAQDMVEQNLGTFKISFPKDTQPFLPFEQLMSVLPAASSHTLPKIFRNLMSDEDSPIIDFYPVDFPIDMNGKKMAWQGVALLPFIDEKRLLRVTRALYDKLSEADRARNSNREPILLVSPHSPIKPQLLELYGGGDVDAVVINDRESRGISGVGRRDESWAPRRPLNSPSSEPISEFTSISVDDSVTVKYEMPSNQTHKSMLVPGYVEPPLVLGPSDVDMIWHRRHRSDRGDDRPIYRKQELIPFSEPRAPLSGGYLAFAAESERSAQYNQSYSGNYRGNGYNSYNSDGYQGHQTYQTHHQGYNGNRFQGYQGSQGRQGNNQYDGQNYQGYQGYRR